MSIAGKKTTAFFVSLILIVSLFGSLCGVKLGLALRLSAPTKSSTSTADPAPPQEDKKPLTPPNILLLFPDQWKYDWDGFHDHYGGSGEKHMPLPLDLPTIRHISEHGTRFKILFP